MAMRHPFTLALACLIAVPAAAQELPPVGGSDPRLETIDFASGDIVHIATSPETIQTVLFAQGDQIRSVIVSDPSAYSIGVAASGDAISFKAANGSALAMVSVKTDKRSYDLELASGGTGPVVSIYRFTYGEPSRPAPRLASTVSSAIPRQDDVEYRFSGSKLLRPAEIGDDGQRTYMSWDEHQAMPAVFALSPSGTEQMVDAYVRNGLLTIDQVHDRLVFRIDRETASVRRIKKGERHGRRVSTSTG